MFRVIGRNIRNILLCLFSVILLVTICLAGAVFIGAKAESEKIVPQIRNGDFESDRTDWTLWTAINGIAGQPDAEFKIVSDENAYEGKSLNVVSLATNTGVRAVVETASMMKVSPSTTYTIRYMINTESMTSVVTPCVMQYKNTMGTGTVVNANLWLYDYQVSGVTLGWEEVFFTFTTAEDAGFIKFKLDLWPTGTSPVYLDNFTAELVDTSNPSDFNGGLESEDGVTLPAEWYIREKASVSVDTSVYCEGKNSLHITRKNYLADLTIRSNEKVDVEPNQQYRFSYRIKSLNSDFASAVIKASIFNANNTVVAEIQSGETILNAESTASGWSEIFVIKNMPVDAVAASISIIITKGKADCYIDNVTARQNIPLYENFDALNADGSAEGWVNEGDVIFKAGKLNLKADSSSAVRFDVSSGCVYTLNFEYQTSAAAKLRAVITTYSYAGKVKKTDVSELPLASNAREFNYSFTIDSAAYATLTFENKGGGDGAIDNVRITLDYDPRTMGSGWQGAWVCYPAGDIAYGMENETLLYRYKFEIGSEAIKSAILQFTADDIWKFYVNGQEIKDDENNGMESWANVSMLDLAQHLQPGENVFAFEVENVTYYTGLLFDMHVLYETGKEERFFTNDQVVSEIKKDDSLDWIQLNYDDSSWLGVYVIGRPPVTPWGNVMFVASAGNEAAMQVKEMSISEQILPGEQGTLKMTVNISKPIENDIQFKIYFWGKFSSDSSAERVPSSVLIPVKGSPVSEWQVGKDITLEYKFLLPDFVEAGSYMIQFDPEQITVTGNDNYLDNKMRGHYFRVVKTDIPLTTSEIKKVDGITKLFVNGKETAPMMYLREQTTVFKDQYASGMENSGFNLIGLPNARSYEMNRAGAIWIGNDLYDFAPLDDVIYETLAGAPESYLMLSFDANPPEWWLDENPDARALDNKGNTYTNGVSYASQKWRDDVIKYYNAMIDYILKQPYASHIFGIKISAGVTFEWQHYGLSLSTCGDYSVAARDGFRAWLTEKYKTDAALQQAWGNDSVTLLTAEVPTWEERQANPYTYILDGVAQRNVIDYHLFYSDMVTESILQFSEAVKEACGGRWIVGTYNGYILSTLTYEGNGLANASISRVLDSENVDFLCAPMCYDSRMSGMSATYMAMVDSVLNAGKLFFMECDSRTVYFENDTLTPALIQEWGKTYTLRETIEQMKRDFASVLTKGAGLWWYDMNGGWFDDAEIYDLLSVMKAEADANVADPGQNVSRIAWVSDDDIINTTPYHFDGTYGVTNYTHYYQKEELAHVGAPHDMLYLSDLEKGIAKDYDVYLINAVNLDEEEVAALDKIKKDGVTIIWVGIPGIYAQDGSLSAERISSITGINVAITTDPLPYSVRTEGEHALLNGFSSEIYGNRTIVDGTVTPVAYITDTEATVLGKLTDTDKAGLAVKEIEAQGGGTWTSVYSSVACIPAEIIRNALKEQGGHVYLETKGDALFVNSRYIGVNSPYGGQRTLYLESASDVYDVFTGECVAQNVTSFDFEIGEGCTRLFKVVAPGTQVNPIVPVNDGGGETDVQLIIAICVGVLIVAGAAVSIVLILKKTSVKKD